jgi:predicted nucleic acid-binding protein
MILVDTSVWINLFSTNPNWKVSLDQLALFATCPPVIQEVVQGLKVSQSSERIRGSILSLPRLGDPISTETFLHAADIYREGRRRGYTIRSSVDCLIAAIAIEVEIPVWHADRDFSVISDYTALRSMLVLPR